MDLNNSLEEYKNAVLALQKQETLLKEEATKQGYTFDKENMSLIKNKDEVYAMDIFFSVQTTYESYGDFLVYAGLVLLENDDFETIKDLITKDKFNWVELFSQDFFSKYNDFMRVCDLLPAGYIDEDIIGSIWLKSDDVISLEREGVIDVYGEMYFKAPYENYCDGYVTILKMEHDIFEKNKHSQLLKNKKYCAENQPYKFSLED